MKPRVLVILAPGTNRDRDVVEALEAAGGEALLVPLGELSPAKTRGAGMLVVPGGFSYGDALGAGALLALDLRKRFAAEVAAFVEGGRPVLGICNGFQALVKAGILPGPDFQEPERSVTLTANARGRFECRWVRLTAPASASFWTAGLVEGIDCPVAHGEGRLAARDSSVLERLFSAGRVALLYARKDGSPAGGAFPENPNGSARDIAGLCNAAGNVLGLMPHPEDAYRRGRGALGLFRNGIGRVRAL